MLKFLFIPLTLLLLSGCGDNGSSTPTVDKPGAYTIMDTTSGDIPYPNDIMFAGSTDGTLNIPYDPTAPDAGVKSALNVLDGFSTTSPITVGISDDMDPLTLPGNLHLYQVITQASPATSYIPAVGAVVRELAFGTEYYATVRNGRIVILPLQPLQSHTSYMVVLTDGIKNSEGQSLEFDGVTAMLNGIYPLVDAQGIPTVYFDMDPTVNTYTAQKLEGLRQLTQAMIAQAMGQGIARDDIIMAWSFTTQSIGQMVQAFAEHNASGVIGVQPTGLTTAQALPGALGLADIYAGTLNNLPYYLGVSTAENPIPAMTEHFTDANGSSVFEGLPHQTASISVPLLVTVPHGQAEPAEGWPVVIFQHAILGSRLHLLAIADAFASAGYAAIAMDLPLHGVSDNTNPLYMGTLERTFNFDLYTYDSEGELIAYVPDGVIDPSGEHYMNLGNLLTIRDNLRTSTSDLIALKNALGSAVGVHFDTNRVAFAGHSLGTIAAFGFLSQENALEGVSLAMPGGGVAQLLSNSRSFGQEIRTALWDLAGIVPDSAEYESFLLAAQTVIDDGDSINYAAQVGAKQNVFTIEVVGDGTPGSDDRSIPNSIPTAPLSGTDPLLAMMQTTPLTATAPGYIPVSGSTVARFTLGQHNSIFDPSYSLEATIEMQQEVASFVGSRAATVLVENYSILK